ncbi:MAG: NAD-dependent formate dehydrogenase [Rhodospirillales bacterium]|nr:NAD-dependent formate dehydrogenase [Rhodospirillales bacterium]
MDESKRLVTMANQIAAFFRPYPEEEAIKGTYEHLIQFWDPRMRVKMIAHVEAGGEGLSPIALAATKQLKKPASAA